MTCEELKPEYGAFALGAADEPERSAIRRHLETNCPNCVPGVSAAMATVAAMTGAVKLVDPSRGLRRRVANVVAPIPDIPDNRRSWSSFFPWLVVAGLSVALILIARPARRPASDLARLEAAIAILNDPAARDIPFGEASKPSRGRVFVSPGRGVVFIGADLPRLDPGRTFELWLLPASGKPVPAGTFLPREDAGAVYVHGGDAAGASAVTVTVEPEGGSAEPTTKPFIIARL